jgi:hypothetical protein
MTMNSTNSKGECWVVDGKEGKGFLLIDEESTDENKFIRVYGDDELAQRVAAAMNAA